MGLWSMRWIWLKRASKYLCVESDQKGPLIYALSLTEKSLQIFISRIWSKRVSDLCVESAVTEKGLQIFMRRIWPERASDLCVESDLKGLPMLIRWICLKRPGLWSTCMRWVWLKRTSKYLWVESNQKGPLDLCIDIYINFEREGYDHHDHPLSTPFIYNLNWRL